MQTKLAAFVLAVSTLIAPTWTKPVDEKRQTGATEAANDLIATAYADLLSVFSDIPPSALTAIAAITLPTNVNELNSIFSEIQAGGTPAVVSAITSALPTSIAGGVYSAISSIAVSLEPGVKSIVSAGVSTVSVNYGSATLTGGALVTPTVYTPSSITNLETMPSFTNDETSVTNLETFPSITNDETSSVTNLETIPSVQPTVSVSRYSLSTRVPIPVPIPTGNATISASGTPTAPPPAVTNGAGKLSTSAVVGLVGFLGFAVWL